VNGDGKTPLEVAKTHRKAECEAILEAAGVAALAMVEEAEDKFYDRGSGKTGGAEDIIEAVRELGLLQHSTSCFVAFEKENKLRLLYPKGGDRNSFAKRAITCPSYGQSSISFGSR